MKKILNTLAVILLLLVNFTMIKAASFLTATSSSKTSVTTIGEQFTVTFAVRNSTGISALTANFNYDSSKLEIVSSAAESGFALTLGTKLVVDHTEVKSGNFNIAKVTFKTKSAFVLGDSTQVGISNVVGSDGFEDISAAGSSVTIKMEAPKSTNNYLSSLGISQGTLNFNKTTTSYTVIVDNNITSVTLSATAEDSKATISGTGTKSLKVYSNTFNIVVTAENGSKKTYSVNVVRRDADGNAGALSTNNNLASLRVEGCELTFVESQLEYRCEVDNLTTNIEITAQPANNKATYVIANVEELKVGDNPITITVTSESGAEKVYIVVVNRSNNAPTVPIETVKEALSTTTANEVAIKNPADGIISEDIMAALKASGKKLLIQGFDEKGTLIYEWSIDGSKIGTPASINTMLIYNLDIDPTIEQLTNYAKGIFLDFEKNEVIPEGTIVKLKVTSVYQDGDKVRLYYYNVTDKKMELISEDLEVIDGHISISLSHTSEYFITQSDLGNKGSNSQNTGFGLNMWIILAGIELLVIIALGVLLTRKSRKVSQ
ncbi:MAG: hypothetical protein CVU96_06225 [Firmicutes bacterium HGW-Firmicutes-20]|jgi:hypothetical protein|nr:MAG: hypothetical protein CVU96_06225 [Firmicutes bacterium HGW-Firmicutes-20]PKM87799.1 MAG: hypothetical protein CVU85_05175 [Firmicutes bacterium HGW-Firmicutes-10]